MGLERKPSEVLDDFAGRCEALDRNVREHSEIEEQIDALAEELDRVKFDEGDHYVVLSPYFRPRFFHVFKSPTGAVDVTFLPTVEAVDLEWQEPAPPEDTIEVEFPPSISRTLVEAFTLPEEPDDVSRRVDRLVSRGGDPDLFAIDHEAS